MDLLVDEAVLLVSLDSLNRFDRCLPRDDSGFIHRFASRSCTLVPDNCQKRRMIYFESNVALITST